MHIVPQGVPSCLTEARYLAAQVEASQEALSAMQHKNYGKFARWAQSQRLGMVKQVCGWPT